MNGGYCERKTDNRDVLLNTVELARRVERAEIDFCARGADHEAGGRASLFEAGGGRAVFGRLGSPLNKVLGLGLDGPVSDDDLDAIEGFYAARQSPVAIELCPLAAIDLPARLVARGYVPRMFESELARALPYTGSAGTTSDAIRVARTDDATGWLETVSQGFAVVEGDEAVPSDETVRTMAEVMMAFLHPAIGRYIAVNGTVPAGGGATYVAGDIVGIFGTATRAAFRRRGVQEAIVRQVMAAAPAHAGLAIATTAPGSSSQRTFERLGFQVLYTRTIFVKDL
jgi:ribosomal protein S18 acetylase RimI-like enzyme